MNSHLTIYLIMVVLWYLIVGSTFGISAQSFEPNFGNSLNKSKKKKKENPISEKQKIIQNDFDNLLKNDEIIRVETTLVINEVLVFDENDNQVKNLKKEDFIIREDGEIQEIATFVSGGSEALPRSIVLIIDHSASQVPFLETSIEAAKVLIEKLNPNDQIAIVTDNIELLQNFTNDKKLLKEKLDLLKQRVWADQIGKSKQYSALMATLNELFDGNTLRPIIVFQTDGDEFPSLKGEIANLHPSQPDDLNFSYKDVLKATEITQATIYTIIPGGCLTEFSQKEKFERVRKYLDENDRIFAQIRNLKLKPDRLKKNNGVIEKQTKWLELYQKAIMEIAKNTAGSTKCLEFIDQAGQIYSEILKEMNQRYVIGYYPVNQVRDGKSRKIETEVRGRPNYKIIARKSYILAK